VKIAADGWELHVLSGIERVLRTEAMVVCEMHAQHSLVIAQTACHILRMIERNGRHATDLGENMVTRFNFGPDILQTGRQMISSSSGP
jgi:hypothetical protein